MYKVLFDSTNTTFNKIFDNQSNFPLVEKNNIAVANRQAEYGSTETQLEFLVENGVDAFIARQNEIKNKYPKENE